MTWTRKATVYRTQVTMRPMQATGAYVLWTVPHCIHWATVAPVGTRWNMWVQSLPGYTPLLYVTQGLALAAARDVISLRAGEDLMGFGPSQRVAMGQGKCPKVLDGLLCGQTCQGFSIWCARHPYGRDVGDA